MNDLTRCDFAVGRFKLELIAAAHPDSFVARFLDRRGAGVHRLPVDVDRLDPSLEPLEAAGVRIVDHADIGGGWKTALTSPRSAHGVPTQFWQDPAMSAT